MSPILAEIADVGDQLAALLGKSIATGEQDEFHSGMLVLTTAVYGSLIEDEETIEMFVEVLRRILRQKLFAKQRNQPAGHA